MYDAIELNLKHWRSRREEAKELLRLAEQRCESPGITYARNLLAETERMVAHYEQIRDARKADAGNAEAYFASLPDAENTDKN